MKTCFISRLGGCGDIYRIGGYGDDKISSRRIFIMPKGIYKRKPCSKEVINRLRKLAILKRKPNNCICLVCAKEFHRKPYSIKIGENKYCSNLCRYEHQKVTRLGKLNPQYGTHWQAGSNNPNWRGGKTGKNGYTWEWPRIKREIKKRDKNICQICKIGNGKYSRNNGVHHLDENKKNNSFDNLITICNGCHCKIHKPYLNSSSIRKKKRGGDSNRHPAKSKA